MTATDALVGSEHHPTAWYAEMGAAGKRTFWAATGGWILDAMDVMMFSFAIPAIIAAFSISNADAGLIGTATLLSSAIGGWVAGALADRVGLQSSRSCAALRKAIPSFLPSARSWASVSAANGLPQRF
jgi:MFS family permease